MAGRFTTDQWMVELHSFSINLGFAPVAAVWDQRVMKLALAADLVSGVGCHPRYEAAAETVAGERVGAKEREDERAVGDEIAAEADVEQRDAFVAVAVID